jgi:hypothetical protein
MHRLQHPDRGRIDYLLCATAGELGGGRKSLAKTYGVSETALFRHRKNHIPASFAQAIKVGPFKNEEKLRKLTADTGISVLERFNGLYAGHHQRWTLCLEAGNDQAMVRHGHVMTDILGKIGLLTKELPQSGTHISNNLYVSPDYISLQQRAVKVLRGHPEALKDWLAEFNPRSEPKLIEAAQ